MNQATSEQKLSLGLLGSVDWKAIKTELNERGFAHVRSALPHDVCRILIDNYGLRIYRKTVTMERHRFGLGEYKYFDYPLPEIVQT
ncbi:MAG TPA: hypothetical protein VJL58_06100, partial [Pyrinomonadaceae bacterium]|nr:hypothetical protein [Pyrinomonadaceae bacterium]